MLRGQAANRSRAWALAAGGVALALLPPLALDPYRLSVLNLLLIYLILALSLDLLVGQTGLLSLGHAAFFAVGAYAAGILSSRYGWPFVATLPAGVALAALAGALLARPIVHLRGDYLLITTLAFGEAVRIALVQDVFGLTGGPNGILGIGRPELLGLTVRRPHEYYVLLLAVAALVVAFLWLLYTSRLGRAFRYVREDAVAAEAMGVETARIKLLAFTLSAGLAGLAGVLYAHWATIIAPETFGLMTSVTALAIVVLGGPGSLPGVVVGAVALVVLPELFRELSQYRMLVFGLAMVVMAAVRPQGLWPAAAPGVAGGGDRGRAGGDRAGAAAGA